jgi:hypothetical protein
LLSWDVWKSWSTRRVHTWITKWNALDLHGKEIGKCNSITWAKIRQFNCSFGYLPLILTWYVDEVSRIRKLNETCLHLKTDSDIVWRKILPFRGAHPTKLNLQV